MTAVVLVHGIFNQGRALTPGEAAAGKAVEASSRLEAGLKAAGLAHVSTPEMVMAYYAHQLADDWEAQADVNEEYALDGLSPGQLADAWEWLRAAGVPDPLEPQGHLTVPVRWGLSQLAARRAGLGAMGQMRQRSFELLSRLVVATLQDTDAYTSRPERRRAVRATVAQAIDASSPQVVVAAFSGFRGGL